MIKHDQIPDNVWHTAMSTYHKTIKKRPGSAWQEAIAAALNAWPGMDVAGDDDWCAIRKGWITLPQEARDE